jgi:phosphatidylglycerophosphate synthase
MFQTPDTKLSYSDFWQFRGRQSFWLTRQVSYRIGSLLALFACRTGLSPRAVTILSLITGVGGACAVAAMPWLPPWQAGVILFLTLHLAYGLDCADGVLARARKCSSRSGALLDKMADLLGSMTIPGILGIAAFGAQTTWADDFSHAFLIWWSMFPRLAITTLVWIKEGMTPENDRKGADDSREHTLFWRLKKFAGNLQDDVIYRSGIAISWGFGCYWDFILIFQGYCCLLLLVYIITSYREVVAAERQ